MSAGFDAHIDDPLAGMRLHVGRVRAADRCALPRCRRRVLRGRVVAVTEGGYDLAGLGELSLRAVIAVLERRDVACRCRRAPVGCRAPPRPRDGRGRGARAAPILEAIIKGSRLKA